MEHVRSVLQAILRQMPLNYRAIVFRSRQKFQQDKKKQQQSNSEDCFRLYACGQKGQKYH